MKKTSIFSILIVFIAAVFMVGFLGTKYTADEIIEVESISWFSDDLENEGYKIVKYTEEEKEELKISHDALLEAPFEKELESLTIHIICLCKPNNADNKKLDFTFEATKGVSMNVVSDNEADIIFTGPAEISLNVKSTDGLKISYTIKINIFDEDKFEWM